MCTKHLWLNPLQLYNEVEFRCDPDTEACLGLDVGKHFQFGPSIFFFALDTLVQMAKIEGMKRELGFNIKTQTKAHLSREQVVEEYCGDKGILEEKVELIKKEVPH